MTAVCVFQGLLFTTTTAFRCDAVDPRDQSCALADAVSLGLLRVWSITILGVRSVVEVTGDQRGVVSLSVCLRLAVFVRACARVCAWFRFGQALEFTPDNAKVLHRLGQAYHRAGDFSRCVL